MRQRLLGYEHPDVADSLNNLGLNYFKQGNYKEAESLFLQAFEIRERRLGVKLSH
ncbi:tetratricopeptide repeat protein [uncultured Nostoc sp.]|uniref:tetratricopeptide repeat protein n=1 Tax=uncultured Nostoc sp. TaxID=340711 RepID=UPI0035CA5515